jgi:phenylacetate-coenzyme A ligase PaaK-like adenylate-forming protein
MIPLMTLWHYLRARRLRFTQRAVLEAYQARQLKRFAQRVLANSPYFQPYSSLPLTAWPTMDKAVMMANFRSDEHRRSAIGGAFGLCPAQRKRSRFQP